MVIVKVVGAVPRMSITLPNNAMRGLLGAIRWLRNLLRDVMYTSTSVRTYHGTYYQHPESLVMV